MRELNTDEISLCNGVEFMGKSTAVISNAIKDFYNYLKVGFGIKQNQSNAVNINYLITKENLEDVCGYKC